MRGLLLFAALGAGACATYEPMPIPPGMLEMEGAVEEAPAAHGYLGLEVVPNESDSLENLQIQPGLRVTRVAPGSPAERAGIRPSDILLQFDGIRTDDRERLESLLLAAQQPRRVLLQVQRGTRVLEVEADVEVREGGGPGRTLYHVDRARVRAAFRNGAGGAYPEVAYLAEDSPLAAAGVAVGDLVLAFQGYDPGSAAELVRRIAVELEPGERGVLRVQQAGGAVADLEFHAWEPERVLTGFEVWPLVDWEQDLEQDRVRFVIGDFFLFSLFKRVRYGAEADYSILSIIQWHTGEARLERTGEVSAGAARAEHGAEAAP